jgi:hypothetical protein
MRPPDMTTDEPCERWFDERPPTDPNTRRQRSRPRKRDDPTETDGNHRLAAKTFQPFTRLHENDFFEQVKHHENGREASQKGSRP